MSSNSEKVVAENEKFFTKLGIPLASLKTAREAIEMNRYTGTVICLVSDAGIGKTQLVQQIAANREPTEPFTWHGKRWEKDVPATTLYLAHMQAEDMGVPYPTRAKRNEILQECNLFLQIANSVANDDSRAVLYKNAMNHAIGLSEHLLQSGSPLDDGTFEFLVERSLKDLPPEGILFLDEWNRADKATIKAFFTLLEDRKVHGIKLIPDRVQIVAAMNPSDGAYSVNESEKDHAFRRRLAFVAVTCNVGAWLNYAESRFHPYVVDFIKASPDSLYDMKLRDAGKAFPCPATWEKVSKLFTAVEKRKMDLQSEGVRLTVSGIIGDATAGNFLAYVKDNQIIISPDEVLQNYTEKSKVRKKVQHLVSQARNDVLRELCSALAIALFRDQPEPQTVALPVTLYMSDLKNEMAMAMIEHDFGSASSQTEGGNSYLSALSVAMHVHPHYQNLFKGIGNAMTKVREEAGESILDPLSP